MEDLVIEISNKFDADLICIYTAIDGEENVSQEDYVTINTLINSLKPSRKKLMIMISSQGGDLVHTMKFVDVLRQKYDHIDVYVPRIGKSSMTLMAMLSDVVYVRKESWLSDFSPLKEQPYTHGDITILLNEMLGKIQLGMLKRCDDDEKLAAVGVILRDYMFTAKAHGETIFGEKFVNDFDDYGNIQVYSEEKFNFLKLNALDVKLQNEFVENVIDSKKIAKIVSFNKEFIYLRKN